ncbi:GNAT family N-acetyltransferase [Yersinia ruckeri]|uniref:Acetyltransferase, GNAT family n=1 Tax=Yersinia ruckeri TaxID=29486 RepID=A0A085U5N5_YERRU|nr:GNAT family N-acetyltransferase [Yersinia ruckeri]AJI95135.1 acetyltransferase domain protein [Yersinia ruckeri]AKA39575.1 GNAT family acetyltransferase [Yersinia ruckeri]ARZ01881.1 GNAT family acetyltransferase [Yersinia ruckeri]EKN3345406.1 GNAT family N-acetyltransferase [Yersinia ruckeri]EKN3363081.1 GNAT family N-acetyltransferase [Yersinia ruckeri]
MKIRQARLSDEMAISQLLVALDYPGTGTFLQQRLQQLIEHPDSRLLVATLGSEVCGFISLHFIPQIALVGEFCRISYLCVSEKVRGEGIGKQLLDEAEKIACERGCDRMELHSHSRRIKAHSFYAREGYEESPKYFVKRLPFIAIYP